MKTELKDDYDVTVTRDRQARLTVSSLVSVSVLMKWSCTAWRLQCFLFSITRLHTRPAAQHGVHDVTSPVSHTTPQTVYTIQQQPSMSLSSNHQQLCCSSYSEIKLLQSLTHTAPTVAKLHVSVFHFHISMWDLK